MNKFKTVFLGISLFIVIPCFAPLGRKKSAVAPQKEGVSSLGHTEETIILKDSDVHELAQLLHFAKNVQSLDRRLTAEEKGRLTFIWKKQKCTYCSESLATNQNCCLCCLRNSVRMIAEGVATVNEFLQSRTEQLKEVKQERDMLRSKEEEQTQIILRLTQEKAAMSQQFAEQTATLALEFAKGLGSK